MSNLETTVRATKELGQDSLTFLLKGAYSFAVTSPALHCFPTVKRKLLKEITTNSLTSDSTNLGYFIGFMTGSLSCFPQMAIYVENPKYFAILALTNVASAVYEKVREIKNSRVVID